MDTEKGEVADPEFFRVFQLNKAADVTDRLYIVLTSFGTWPAKAPPAAPDLALSEN